MSITGRVGILRGPGQPFEVAEAAFDDPGEGEVLVRMAAVGVCHTDLGVQAGGIPFPLPGIIGHEGAGVVERVGDGVTSVAPGDKVLLSFTSCGECANCAASHPAYCQTWLPRNLVGALRPDDSAGVTVDGETVGSHFFGQSSFAEWAIADERSIVRLDENADLTALAPLGCSVMTAFGSVWGVLDPGNDAVVAVYGAGAVGLSAVMAAAARSPRILIAVDIVPERLELARELGATHTIDSSREDLAARIAEITDGAGVTASFDTTGIPAVARQALDNASAGGTVLVCGAPPPGTEIPVDIQGILPGKILRGVTMGDTIPQNLIPELARMHAEGRLPLDKLAKTYRLDELQSAADDMLAGRTVKPVIVL